LPKSRKTNSTALANKRYK